MPLYHIGGEVVQKGGELAVHENCCTAAFGQPCENCDGDFGGPCRFQVDVSGLANGTCGDCTGYDGSYIVPWDGGNCGSTYAACCWTLQTSNVQCSFPLDVQVQIVFDHDGLGFGEGFIGYYIFVILAGVFNLIFFWDKLGASLPDCKAISSLSVTHRPGGTTVDCDASGVSVTVTAL